MSGGLQSCRGGDKAGGQRARQRDDEEAAQLLHPDDATRIRRALDDLGYTLIPEEPLWRRYDGTWDPDTFAPSDATWWVRYFDYL